MRFNVPPALRHCLASATLVLAACEGVNPEEASPEDIDIPLTGVTLHNGAPSNDELPQEGKSDAVYPERYDLVSKQSPVKSQGSRGVCSIFAATALAEHLYKVSGSNLDLSEQYLQWSVKTQVRGFADSEGSSANYNLRAFSDYGIVEEKVWPYEEQPWGTSRDPACTGKEPAPSKCWTNGSPPAAADRATKYKLPAGRYLNTTVTTIKSHMVSKKTAVIAGGDFFYQSWNHRRSKLPTNSEYWRKGYVLSPNAEDRAESAKAPAGHEFLLVGWDDNLAVPKVDKDGKQVVDSAGRPVMEKGFFLFKNSWGANSFGVANPYGAGYGWISYAYVTGELSAYVSSPPTITSGGGTTGGGTTGGGTTGGGTSSTSEKTYSRTVGKAIPDNSPTGVTSYFDVKETGTVKGVKVKLDIAHPYRGDVTVTLERSGTVLKVIEADGDERANINETISLSGFNGRTWNGRWTLRVVDVARGDSGKLNGWSLVLQK